MPCRAVGGAEPLGKRVGADALAAFGEQEDGEEPLGQRQMGVVEHRAHGDGELLAAAVRLAALEQAGTGALALDPPDFEGAAMAAGGLVAPSNPLKVFTALLIRVEAGLELCEGEGALDLAVHGENVPWNRNSSRNFSR